MLDRVNMACPKCGSRSGSIAYESSQEFADDPETQVGMLRMSVLCDSSHLEFKWVHSHAIWNLLRSYCIADRAAAARIYVLGPRLYPSRWKLWRITDEITGDEMRRRLRLVRRVLRLVLPDEFTWYNGYGDYSCAERDWVDFFYPSGTAYTRFCGLSSSYSEWQALRLAISSSTRTKVFATDVSTWLIKLVGYPLAR